MNKRSTSRGGSGKYTRTALEPPPKEFKMKMNSVTVSVRTERVRGAPYWTFNVYLPGRDDPILSLLSWPGKTDVQHALNKARHR